MASAVVSAALIAVGTHEDALLLLLPLLLVLLLLVPVLLLLLLLLLLLPLLLHQLLLLRLLMLRTPTTLLLCPSTTKPRDPLSALPTSAPPKCFENCHVLPVPALLPAVTPLGSVPGETANAATPVSIVPEEVAATAAAAAVSASRKRPAVLLVCFQRRDMFLFCRAWCCRQGLDEGWLCWALTVAVVLLYVV